jgi:hypothetical protein
MATWLVKYCPYLRSDPDFPDLEQEILGFRILSDSLEIAGQTS